ncbi:hypothetical protein LTR16_003987 [Cryomyces antarcticus]|uniref:ER membrane protein complex subunit 7 beta-sandwich domain-containing protein n=1 Tax=Cryomyces antarcticus TaxID=329879 RepID=A0ABR0KU27_9PEZI|nr:hypothetical protein LTR16_003987 [Cryomyces antarcticus]
MANTLATTVELLSFFKNPMILMALFSLVLIVGMPYMMENMDPETRAEFDEMQKKSPLASPDNPAARLQNFDLAGWMAGKTSGQSEGQSQIQGHGQAQAAVEGASAGRKR